MATITLADVHRGQVRISPQCEELWVMDHEYLPVRGEMSPMDAAAWARLIEQVSEPQRPAFRAWVEDGSNVSTDPSGRPVVSDFEDRYCGRHDAFEDFARELAEEIGLLRDVSDEISTYFDWTRWSRDLAFDYTTTPASAGGVYVFRDL